MTINENSNNELKKDWVIILSNTFYHRDSDRSTENIYEATIFKDKTKVEIDEIGNSRFKGIRGKWEIKSYDEALLDYEKRLYVDPTTKEFMWGRYIDIKDTLSCLEYGEMVGYQYKDETKIYDKDNFPNEFNIEIITKANWRIVMKC